MWPTNVSFEYPVLLVGQETDNFVKTTIGIDHASGILLYIIYHYLNALSRGPSKYF